MSKRVLSVGNCEPDTRAIAALIEGQFEAVVEPVDDLAQTMQQLRTRPYDLVLINRILDRDGSEGLEVIRQIKSVPELRETPVMMITNFAEHQQLAQEAGAIEGFGKQALHAPETAAKLSPLLG